jgi:CHASE2 domain-containing sensor protein
MFELLVFIGAGIGGFVIARDFVRRRLRFVDAVHHPAAPLIAGLGAALITWPLAALPIITTAATTMFGIGTGLGTRNAARQLKSGEYHR